MIRINMNISVLPVLTLLLSFNSSPLSADASTPIIPPTQADEAVLFIPDNGSADRIGSADRLRTLSQEIAAKTCFLHNGILPNENHAALTHSVSEFGEILNALLHGDASRHIIGAEENRKTIHEIKAIMAEWDPIRKAAEDVLADATNATATHAIYAQSAHLLETTSHLLSELEGAYSHPTEVLMADVVLIEFAGRQAMLTQKIAYDACLVWSGYGGQEQIDELHEICANFDQIARALHGGMAPAGIAAAPTDEIRVALEEVVTDWDVVETHLDGLADLDADSMRWIDQVMKTKMHSMEEIVKMYVEYSRRALI